MKKLIVIDGNSLLFRAYYATSFTGNIMRTKEGFPTNAIFGFNNMISKIISSINEGDLLFVSFDTGHKTFRHQEMETYKAQRKPIDEDLILQLPVARELLDNLGVYHYELDGYEGDDIAGTIAKIGSKNNYKVEVYTSDKDYLQLIDDNISICMIKKGLTDIHIMNETTLFEEMGLKPEQIKDYKGLMGDPSDNIKGIPGVGEKTALKLIQQYGSLENIIEAMKNEKSKMAEKIIANQEQGIFCKHIATINTDVPVPFKLDDLVYQGYDFNELSSFYTRYEFFSLLKRLKPSPLKKQTTISQVDNIVIEDVSSFKQIDVPVNAIYLDYNNKNYHHAQVDRVFLSNGSKVYSLDFSLAIKDQNLKAFLENPKIEKYTFDSKALIVLLNKYNIDIKNITFDMLLASYLLDSSLDNDPVTVAAYFGKNILVSDEVSLLFNNKSGANLTKIISELRGEIIDKLKNNNLYQIYNDIELPLAKVLAYMEIEGFPLNRQALELINQKYVEILNNLTNKIYDLAGCQINLSSPKQMANLLFNVLGLPSNKKQSTSIDILNALKDKHPIIPLIIEHRKYSKLVSTYSSGLSDYIFPDGKIHALFNQALTTTGRLSSSEPNLQNISIRDEEGRYIRKAFFYEEENISLLSLDYSQIELRILAHVANCKPLIDIFNNGHDIHAETARKVFSIPEDEEVPSILRRKAKAVNFGIVYGISDWGLAEQISCPVQEAKTIINQFYAFYPEIKKYFDDIISFATENGYVKTLFNRRRYIPEIQSDNHQTREFGKRAAMNAPIQGTAADLIKIAMIEIDKKIKENNLKSCLVLQIHDELIFKVYDDEKEKLYNLVKSCMENVYPLQVKLEVNGSIAKTWYDTK